LVIKNFVSSCRIDGSILASHSCTAYLYGAFINNFEIAPTACCLNSGKFTVSQPIILYRKFTADYIFTGQEIIPGNKVLITDENGVIIDLAAFADAGDDIENFTGMLCPGFVNAHCHLELSHMKGHISQHTGLINFILKVVFERNFEEAIILAAIETAENEMLQNGIVAVGDICNNAITIAQKSKRKLHYHNFIETSGFIGATAKTRFKTSEVIYQAFATQLPANSIVPHAPYSVSPELFELINIYPNNKTLTIHNQETAAENELFQNKEGDFLTMYQQMNIDVSGFKASGKSSLQTYLPALSNYQSLILVHNVCTNADDIEFEKLHTLHLQPPSTIFNNLQPPSTTFNHFQPPSTHYCLCPNANLYITGQLPDVNLLVEQQCNIVLGTDSLASNHKLNILEEIKTLQQHFASIPLQTMLQWATINGAKALQTDATLGSFEKGKTPGVVHIDQLNGLSLTQASCSKRIL
jgi:cytosine/adenosine deaminase-related metal-dependent hydrolase